VWVLDVESGQQRKLLSFSIKQQVAPWINLIGWLGRR
jgi:hypothetical protein